MGILPGFVPAVSSTSFQSYLVFPHQPRSQGLSSSLRLGEKTRDPGNEVLLKEKREEETPYTGPS